MRKKTSATNVFLASEPHAAVPIKDLTLFGTACSHLGLHCPSTLSNASIIIQSNQIRSDMSSVRSDGAFSLWEFVHCGICYTFWSDPPRIPLWATDCGHIICNDHLSGPLTCRYRDCSEKKNLLIASTSKGPNGSCSCCGLEGVAVLPLKNDVNMDVPHASRPPVTFFLGLESDITMVSTAIGQSGSGNIGIEGEMGLTAEKCYLADTKSIEN